MKSRIVSISWCKVLGACFLWSSIGLSASEWRVSTIERPGDDGVHSLREDGQGGLLLAGHVSTQSGDRDLAVFAVDQDGASRAGFGEAGVLTMGSSGDDQAVDAAPWMDESGAMQGFYVLGQFSVGDRDFSRVGSRGKIDLALIRLLPDGSLDKRFGEGGVLAMGGSEDDEVIVHLNNYSEPGLRLDVSPEGVAFVAMTRSGDGDFAKAYRVGEWMGRDGLVAWVTHAGTWDESYAKNGRLRFGFRPGAQEKQRSGHDFAFSLRRRDNGWLVAGYTVGTGWQGEGERLSIPGNVDSVGNNAAENGEIYQYKMDGYALALDEEGLPDKSFGNSGFSFVSGTRQEKLYDASPAIDGGWLLTGRSSSTDLMFARPETESDSFAAFVVKFDANGKLDTDFGEGGTVVFDASGNDQGNRLAQSEDGDIWLLTRSDSHEFPFLAKGGGSAVVVLQLSEEGELKRRWSIDGGSQEKGLGMLLTESGVLLAGVTQSTDGVFSGRAGEEQDVFVARLDFGRPELREESLSSFVAPEAKQGVAVDDEYVYVISNHAIAKYGKSSGRRIARWECPEGEPLVHLNAGIVLDGKLYCAHSNYPGVPMTSSIEIWDPNTLEHLGSHSFGIMAGSCTWIDRKDGFWYVCFAHYSNRAAEPSRDPSWTTLVKFDADWNRVEGWVFPLELVSLFGKYSSSGGAFGPDGRLYVTGHDNTALYVLDFPEAGPVLRWVDTVEIEAEGQAICWDPSEPWVLYSILKKDRLVLKSRIERGRGLGNSSR